MAHNKTTNPVANNPPTYISNIFLDLILRRTEQVLVLHVLAHREAIAGLDLDDALSRLIEAGALDPYAGPLRRQADQIRDGPVPADLVLEGPSRLQGLPFAVGALLPDVDALPPPVGDVPGGVRTGVG